MSSEMNSKKKKKEKRGGVLFTLGYFALVALVVAAVAYLTSPGEVEPVDLPASAEETTTTTAVVATGEDVQFEDPDVVPGEEPIADAAEIILPSVVHIQVNGSVGAGVIYDESGLIMTAAHVVGDSETVSLRFENGQQVTGEVLGAVPGVDIAVIEVETDGLVAAEFNLAKPRVGQMAIAIGSPWGLESTVTAGIISAVDQANCSFEACYSRVQTDAAINPGNSGGPLVDRHGRVLGINVSIFTESGANDGVGFAVPASIAMEYAESIVSGVPIETAYLGVQGGPASSDQAGAVIVEVFPDTGAAAAGIEVDDVIISVDGVEIRSGNDLGAQIRAHRPGDVVEVVLLRDGETITVEVTLGVRPDDLS